MGITILKTGEVMKNGEKTGYSIPNTNFVRLAPSGGKFPVFKDGKLFPNGHFIRDRVRGDDGYFVGVPELGED